jgi:alginate O-acetyltransferase complex protein AlgI
MLFNSLHFAAFFTVTFVVYLALRHKWQNVFLLLASYIFYAFWDWRFLSLVLLSTAFNYYFGLAISSSDSGSGRKRLLILIIALNLVMLGLFKYFNFFAENLRLVIWALGFRVNMVTLDIILPLGISFYTFKAMSYPIDIYRKIMRPSKNIYDFALFIAFFPNMIAGPIDRARDFIPQITARRVVTLNKIYHGSWLFFWGLFKKIVIADNLARLTDVTLGRGVFLMGLSGLAASYIFAFQVYADFSGYSNMARGIAEMMGFELAINFRSPFFSKNIYQLWQRWHISLTRWVKEYIYYPLALAKFWGRKLAAPLVMMITWTIMGLWHGAAWKFVLWGSYHGVLLVIYSYMRPYLKRVKISSPALKRALEILKIFLVFNLFSVGLLFFAAETAGDVFLMLRNIVQGFFSPGSINIYIFWNLLILAMPVLAVEYFQYRKDDEFVVFRWPVLVRAGLYFAMLYGIIIYGDFSAQTYYYFQF